ncbi:hypothetical protein [Chryseobacterium indoltheticum]|uniref:hypothetical protein n=1 Tax=Chryseobacterium indoltheticum TaxID=254 RepID=UPI003F4957DD
MINFKGIKKRDPKSLKRVGNYQIQFYEKSKKINRQAMKTIQGGINCQGGQICLIDGKWKCMPYDGCGGGNQP